MTPRPAHDANSGSDPSWWGRLRRVRRLPLLSWLCFAAAAHADIITVGAGSGCDHGTIQAAANDAEARPGHDTIHITRTQAYVAQAARLSTTESLTLAGGFASCDSTVADAVKTQLDGAGGLLAPVLAIDAASPAVVTLQALRITGGDSPSTLPGGGIRFDGSGELALIDNVIEGNRAGDGGGIHFHGTGEFPRLSIRRDNLILENIADARGGGIHMQGGKLDMVAAGSSLVRNRATIGGGLYLHGRDGYATDATIHSGGSGGFATIDGNIAEVGGGIAIQGVPGGVANVTTVTIASFDPQRPLRIARNRATHRGGALALQAPAASTASRDVFVNIVQAAIEGNTAPEAAAISMGESTDPDAAGASALRMTLSAVTDNSARDGDGEPGAGAILSASAASDIELDRVRMQGNDGGPLLRSEQARIVALTNSLLTDNEVRGSVLSLDVANPIFLRLHGNTVAGNALSALDVAPVIAANAPIEFYNTILWQPGRQSLQPASNLVSDVLASELSSLGNDASIVFAEPRFIDPARRDYRLQAASAAVDFSAVVTSVDLDSAPRGIDLDGVVDYRGAVDLGAYERQSLGNLVLNEGFAEDLRLWDASSAGVATRVDAGASGSGAVRIAAAPAPGGELIGLTQCIHVPAAGRYRLDGAAYGIGSDAASRDAVSLRWRLRANTGGESCIGGIDDAGMVNFPASDTFAASVEPGVIDVPVAQWTRWSTIEVALRVEERGTAPGETTSGLFDDIVLERLADPLPLALFMDGFE